MSRGSSGHVSHVTSIRGSHEQLIKLGGITVDKSAWSNMTGFVSASLGMTLNHHSLYLLPLSIIRHGGLSFLLLYSALVILLGAAHGAVVLWNSMHIEPKQSAFLLRSQP